MSDDPIALARAAATPPQPVPLRAAGAPREPQASGSLHVRGRSPTRDGTPGPGGSTRGSSPASVRGSSPPPVALGSSPPVPYQALPVRGPVITHNMTAGLPVLDPGKEPSEEFEARVRKVIDDYKAKLIERTEHHMGYPYNLDFDSYKDLEGLSRFCINNLGDPFIESNYGVHSREFEIGVLEWFARLWEADDYWGYITNCGTEGNLHGILVGRENHPDGILYASAETHYSAFKAARMYRMDVECVPTVDSGEVDYAELQAALERNRGRAAIVVVNCGTTVRGAVDDLDAVLAALAAAGYGESDFFIHVDGALFGLMMPFVQQAPRVSFRKPIGSVSVSGHKFVGAPMPCGVVMTRSSLVEALSSDVEYLNSRDATIMGSRNGHAPIYMWHTLTRKGMAGMARDVEACLTNARLLQSMLESAGVKTMLNRLSSTVVFERPPEEEFIRKWQLACEGDIAHVVVMPNIKPPKLEAFVKDLVACRARCGVGPPALDGADGNGVETNGVETNGCH